MLLKKIAHRIAVIIFEDHLAEIPSLEEYEDDQTAQTAVERELIFIGEA